MNPESNEPRHVAGAGGRHESAMGGADPMVPQAADKRQPRDTSVLADLWARAEIAWAMSDFPEYGSPECDALDETDPRKLAAMLSAAEKWRQL